MGFGFNLFFILILLPLTGILLLVWLITRKKIFGKTLGIIWLSIIGLAVLASLGKTLTSTKELEKKDYYGHYIINRDFFPGKQADWQYDKFRFEIKENDSIYFYVKEKEKILNVYRGYITTTNPNDYISERLIIDMVQPTHHIMTSNPITYRSTRDFYLVFYSPKFNNVYFKKGEWKPIK
jgi:hypothetical protein